MSSSRAPRFRSTRLASNRAILLAGLVVLATLGISAPASATITSTSNANDLANAIVPGGGVSTATLDLTSPAPPLQPNAVADSGSALADFATNGSTYTIMTSGDPQLADNPNGAPDDGEELESAADTGRGNTAYDVSTLSIPVTVPAGTNCVALDYRFLSEEFPEFVGTEYNDAFIAELDNSNWTTSGSNISAPGDFAANIGKPVSVNGVGPVAVSPAESAGTTYDAATGLVTTKRPITPGAHTVHLSIFDQGDAIYDSAVFLDNLRFINESPATCKPPEVTKVTPPPAGTPQPAGISVGSSVKFKGKTKAVLTVNVPGPGTLVATDAKVSARAGRATASKKKKALIKESTVQATQAGPVEVTISLSKTGKKALKKKGKAKVTVRLSFTPSGASAGAPSTATQVVKFKKKKKH